MALVTAGILMRTFIGRMGAPDAERTVQTVVRTETVATTKTVTRTRTKTVTSPAGTTGPGGSCSSDYTSACVPDDATEVVTCADIPGRGFPSVGDDPYALDPDGDGMACES